MTGFFAEIKPRFVCPRCGGFAFGTSQQAGEESMGHCHSEGGYRCAGFSWKRSEDWKVFRLVVECPEGLGGMRMANDANAIHVTFVPADEQAQVEHAESQTLFWGERMKQLEQP